MPASITEDDIHRLVPAFYDRIRKDAMLGPIFNGAIEDWPHHIDKLQAFWSSVMLTSGRYKGQPMTAHVRHEQHMTSENFARWLGLWRQTAAELLTAEAAAAFQDKADRIAESLQLGMQFYRDRRAACRAADRA
ncbi:group III truncated hemoglobin [Sphingomonas cannabina]|uniref:group III truncated hemoglobin n=1 Tax=Sphingomonas cannabina TaxID=2899123 RepID=UPI001F1BF87D|nr:group III truncated hemoglobin [Sphingomonas cannabina]UIJ46311.1 group III truncated hemoglobin [Sphingomonas cannabina]